MYVFILLFLPCLTPRAEMGQTDFKVCSACLLSDITPLFSTPPSVTISCILAENKCRYQLCTTKVSSTCLVSFPLCQAVEAEHAGDPLAFKQPYS